ncbi:MAG: ABC transporter ATP-binding protein [Myxococcota bacterium]
MSAAATNADLVNDARIALRGIEKGFGGRPVLRGVDLTVAPGKIVTILGGSGTGKSVLLKHMIGLLRPDRGRVFVAGRDVTELGEAEWVEVRKGFGYVFQGSALFDSLSVLENVAYPMREHQDSSEPEVKRRVADCLEAVGLSGIEAQMPAELSGGMRKRVAVARAIAMEPDVLLYDEPTTGLDPGNSRRIGELVLSVRARLGAASVIVTHDLALCETVSDHVALLAEGRFAVEGTPAEIRSSSDPAVREFLEGHGGDGPRPGHRSGTEGGIDP